MESCRVECASRSFSKVISDHSRGFTSMSPSSTAERNLQTLTPEREMGKKERKRGKKEKKRGEKRARRGAFFEKLYKHGTNIITISLCITYSYQ